MAQKLAKHGSNAGYQREQKTGNICDRCRSAHRVYNTQYTKTGKAQGLHYGTFDVIDHLAKAPGRAPGTRRHAQARAGTLPEVQAEAITMSPEADNETGLGTAEAGIGQRLREAVSRLAVPNQNDGYVTDPEIPEYLHTVDSDPEPQDDQSATVNDQDEFVITKEARVLIEENMGTYLSVIGMSLEIIDPYCGPILADNLDNIVGRWSKVVARYPRAAKLFMGTQGGVIMDWIGAIQATWPVLYAMYEHHLSHSVMTKKGVVFRVQTGSNGQTPPVDPVMPPEYAYTTQ
jgi:hypothetical protein